MPRRVTTMGRGEPLTPIQPDVSRPAWLDRCEGRPKAFEMRGLGPRREGLQRFRPALGKSFRSAIPAASHPVAFQVWRAL